MYILALKFVLIIIVTSANNDGYILIDDARNLVFIIKIYLAYVLNYVLRFCALEKVLLYLQFIATLLIIIMLILF